MSELQTTWFFLVAVIIAIYAVLDGFDLGIGMLHPFAKGDDERRALLQAIGPVWDGNEVWLLAGGGAIFAVFPIVYAVLFSAFYLPILVVLLGLMMRAVSIEFRNKLASKRWAGIFDSTFAAGSVLVPFGFGAVMGNILKGMPLDVKLNFAGSLSDLMNIHAILGGLVVISLFAVHGACFAALKCGESIRRRAAPWAAKGSVAFIMLFIATCAFALANGSWLADNFRDMPMLAALPLMAVISEAASALSLRRSSWMGFAFSTLAIIASIASVAAALFPRIVPAIGDLSLSITAANASSSPYALGRMLIILAIGLPLVVAYNAWIYRAFSERKAK